MATRNLSRISLPIPKALSPFHNLARNRSVAPLFFSASTMASPTSKKVLVPIANGTEPMEAVITMDVLRRSGAEVTIASVEKNLCVDSRWGIKLVADVLIIDCEGSSFDLISLPGGMPGAANLRDCRVLESIVKKHAEEGGLYAAICAAPAVALGSWGLLKGLKATCYPSFMDKMPSNVTKVESRVVVDGRVITSRGPGTALEFALILVEQLYGKDKAEEVAELMVMRPHHGVEYTVTELNPVEWKYDNTPQVLVPLANGTEEMEAITIIDTLRRAKIGVVVASVEEKQEIVASQGLKIVADVLLSDHQALETQHDLIILPVCSINLDLVRNEMMMIMFLQGGLSGAQAFADSEKLVHLLKQHAAADKPYGAVCASPVIVLERHGLLKGRKATAYPRLSGELTDGSEVENRVVIDGNVITSRGPGTCIEFALAIIEKLLGREKALELARCMVFA